MEREAEYKIGELFEFPWGKKKTGIMHATCNLPQPYKVFCEIEERQKGWQFTREATFSAVSNIYTVRIPMLYNIQISNAKLKS